MNKEHLSEDRLGMTPDELAQACAAEMSKHDTASASLGIEQVECKAGASIVAMTVRNDMVNGHGIAHGGFIFTLADCAISLASNSYNSRAVAANASIAFLAPCRRGDRLTATAREISRSGRTCIYDVQVRKDNEIIAEFRGTTKIVGGSIIDSMPRY